MQAVVFFLFLLPRLRTTLVHFFGDFEKNSF
jgi:hypothetical protein